MKSRRQLSQTLIALGALAILTTAAACGDDDTGDDDDDSGGGFSAATSAAQGAEGSSAGGARNQALPGLPPATGSPTDNLASVLDRKIIFTAGLTLSVDDVQVAFNDVSRLATAAGGFVERSSFNKGGGDEQDRTATLTLRVPATAYQDTLAALRGLNGATVKTESSQSSEVTEQYTDLQSRQRNLERTEQQYLALLSQAKTITDILTVQDRLDGVRLQIEQIQGRLKLLDDQADLATVDVTLIPVPPAKADGGKNGPKAVGEAFADAVDWFVEASRYVAVVAAVVAVAAIFLAPPVGLVLGIAYLVSRRSRAVAT